MTMKTTLSPANRIAADIAKRNLIWKRSTRLERRVLIARDVIAQVKKGLYQAIAGKYAHIMIPGTRAGMEKDAQTCMLTEGAHCECCGVGSLLLSSIAFKDKVTATFDWTGAAFIGSPYGEYAEDGGYLRRLFGKRHLHLIETAFEVIDEEAVADGYGDCDITTWSRAHARALAFGRRYHTDRNRLIAIMKNIVKNGGTFQP